MSLGRKFVPGLVAGVLAAGLTGCMSGGEKAPSPSGSGSISSSSSPSGSASLTSSGSASGSASASTAVEVPEAARANTPEGATEFAKFFLDAGSQSETTWDTSMVAALSDQECSTCAAQVKVVQESKAKGQRTRDNRFQYQSSQVGPGAAPNSFDVDILATFKASALVNEAGAVVQELPQNDLAMRVSVRWNGDGWRTTQVQGIRR